MTSYMIFTPGSSTPPRGPVSREELASEYAAGVLPTGSRACPVGGGEWLSVAEVLGVTTSEPMVAREVVALPDPERFEVTIDGSTIIGPVSRDQLERGLEAERVPRDALARRVGEEGWRPVLSVLSKLQELDDKTTFKTAPVIPSVPLMVTDQPKVKTAWRIPAATFAVAVLGIFALAAGLRRAEPEARRGGPDTRASTTALAPASASNVSVPTVTSTTANDPASPSGSASAAPVVEGLCDNLPVYFDEVDAYAKQLGQVLPTFKAANIAAGNDILQLAQNGERKKKETKSKGDGTRRAAEAVKAVVLKPGEEGPQGELLRIYDVIATSYEKLSEAFSQGTKGFGMLAEVEEVVERLPKVTKAQQQDIRKMCKALAGKNSTAPKLVKVPATTSEPTPVTRRTQCPAGSHAVAFRLGCYCIEGTRDDGQMVGDAPQPQRFGCFNFPSAEGRDCIWQCNPPSP